MSLSPSSDTNVNVPSRSVVFREQLITSLIAALLGLCILFGVGFAKASYLHNAAHDGRHSAGFPCH